MTLAPWFLVHFPFSPEKVPKPVLLLSLSMTVIQDYLIKNSTCVPGPLVKIQREMAGPTRYYTSDGLPPNNGIPFAQAPAAPQPAPPRRYYTSDGLPPNNGLPIDESSNENSGNSRLSAIFLQLQNLLQGEACISAKAPEPAPTKDGQSFVRDDVLYLFPEKHVTIHFLYAGQRPCDHQGLWTQNFQYKQVKLPLFMTVGEMVSRLGYPGRGLQEMVDLITPVSTFPHHTPTHTKHPKPSISVSFVVFSSHKQKKLNQLYQYRCPKGPSGDPAKYCVTMMLPPKRLSKRLAGRLAMRTILRGWCMAGIDHNA